MSVLELDDVTKTYGSDPPVAALGKMAVRTCRRPSSARRFSHQPSSMLT